MENHSATSPTLVVKDLKIEFRDEQEFIAVNEVSFSIQNGKTLALVGHSGSGKSLTSLAIMGLLPKSAVISGSIRLNSECELINPSEKLLSKVRGKEIGMVFQEPMTALNPIISCGEQLREAILVHQAISKEKAKEEALKWLEQVKLPNPATLYKRFPHQLSGGQKQRVMIAMAMCNHPKLLIADEPTTALDVTVQADIVKLMKELQMKFGTALLFITHDLNLAKTITADFLVMEKGRLISKIPVISLQKIKDSIFTEESDRKPVLEVQNLEVHYEAEKTLFQKQKDVYKAVDNVSFQIQYGETLGLVGESGCGKSTLSRAILGIQPISGGKLFFQEQDITHNNLADWNNLRKKIQIIFQDPFASLNPRIKIGEALKEPMLVHGIVPKKEVDAELLELLNLVQLPATAKEKYPHEFSGGQRQRICIARALALRPRLVICDESVSALDQKIQEQILRLLMDLQKEKQLTYLFITHDLHVVRAISDRVMVMEKGRIVEQGKTEKVMNYPETDYTRKLLAAIPKPVN